MVLPFVPLTSTTVRPRLSDVTRLGEIFMPTRPPTTVPEPRHCVNANDSENTKGPTGGWLGLLQNQRFHNSGET